MGREAVSEDEGGAPEDTEIVQDVPIETLEERISHLEKELQYSAAEMSNMRQKAAKERSEAIRFGPSSLARKILPLIGNMERALNQSDGVDNLGFIEGVRMTLRGLRTALESEGVSHIESMGEKFDPTKMEAIAMIPSPEGVDSGTVVEVVEEGYMIHDRVLRASRVIVAESTEDE